MLRSGGCVAGAVYWVLRSWCYVAGAVYWVLRSGCCVAGAAYRVLRSGCYLLGAAYHRVSCGWSTGGKGSGLKLAFFCGYKRSVRFELTAVMDEDLRHSALFNHVCCLVPRITETLGCCIKIR